MNYRTLNHLESYNVLAHTDAEWKASDLYGYYRYRMMVYFEGPKTHPYTDSKSIPTIGIGINISKEVPSNLNMVLNSVFGDIGLTNNPKDGGVIVDYYRVHPVVWSTIDKVLASGWSANMDDISGSFNRALFDIKQNTSFSLSADGVKLTFDVLADKNSASIPQILSYENQTNKQLDWKRDNWATDYHWSYERLALFSLVWNAPALVGKGIRTALESGTRADVWFDIRYGNNPKNDYGVAKRRFIESQIFGVYDDSTTTNMTTAGKEEAYAIYVAYTLKYDRVKEYEKLFGKFEDKTGTDIKPRRYGGATALAAANQDITGNTGLTELFISEYGSVIGGAVKNLEDLLKPAYKYFANLLGFEEDVTVFDLRIGSDSDLIYKNKKGNDVYLHKKDNDLIGDERNNVLIGGKGADSLNGKAGIDVYAWNTGDGLDTLIEDIGYQGRLLIDGKQAAIATQVALASNNSQYSDHWQDNNSVHYLRHGEDLFVAKNLMATEGVILKSFFKGYTLGTARLGITLKSATPVLIRTDAIRTTTYDARLLFAALDGNPTNMVFQSAPSASITPSINPTSNDFLMPIVLKQNSNQQLTFAFQRHSIIGDTLEINLEGSVADGIKLYIDGQYHTLTNGLKISVAPDRTELVGALVFEKAEIGGHAKPFTIKAQLISAGMKADTNNQPGLQIVPDLMPIVEGTGLTGDFHSTYIPRHIGPGVYLVDQKGLVDISDDASDFLFAGKTNKEIIINLSGGKGHDVLFGDDNNNQLKGDEAGDVLLGGSGSDVMLGGDGDDVLMGGFFGRDVNIISGMEYENGQLAYASVMWPAIIVNAFGAKSYSGGIADEYLADGNDLLDGGTGKDILDGGFGNDLLNGGKDFDMLYGNAGNDFLDGGTEGDFLFGDNVVERIRRFSEDGLPENSALLNLTAIQRSQMSGNDVLEGGEGHTRQLKAYLIDLALKNGAATA